MFAGSALEAIGVRRSKRPADGLPSPLGPGGGVATLGRVGDSREWEWFDAQLAHPDGRATGGEPCVVCDQPVPSNAHWKHRDRHTCSARCNEKLRRRLRRQINTGKVHPPAPEPPLRDGGGVVFRTVEVTAPGEVPFEFLGWGPVVGDVVERHGSITAYLPADPVELDGRTVPASLLLHLNTGASAVVPLESGGHLGRLWLAATDGDGNRVHVRDVFYVEDVPWCWTWETIRDIDADGRSYSWRAPLCANFETDRMWTPAYRNRSRRLRRTSASTAGHARRQRLAGTDGKVERIDPQAIYERDRWTCQLCENPVDPTLTHPHPASASLDHRVPLAAGGEHIEANVQCAHLRCNMVKGART